MRRFCLAALLLVAFSIPGFSEPARRSGDWEKLLALSKQGREKKYEEFEKAGGKIVPTEDGQSFYLLYLPAAGASVIATLHGQDGFAIDSFSAWKESGAIEGKNIGLLCLQWWFGEGEETDDYYRPMEIYREFDRAIVNNRLGNRKVALEGFSRGSANVYGIAAIDQDTRSNHFSLFIANAGGMSPDFPINGDIEDGKFGDFPFEGSDWILFCGGKDPNPDRDGCPAMRRTGDWIKDKGGNVALMIEDPESGHGGFQMNSANVAQAIAIFTK